ncbi:ABC transporter permease [Paenibacillus sp. JNUCC32]|uniref:ABC transporter permease n=1 Tax=Paenibacillus sp. JNUCC32 TaxID=2777984 RepID=UPI001787F3F2|nr:ABC transporter permease [Paenibacillus sp. JNUCC-32]QOT09855.1 ABC transporter permease [Paenibacillus sp. JNUCC-32]
MNTMIIAWFELKRMATSRSVLINQFLLPLILIFILGNALSGWFGNDQEFKQPSVRVGLVLDAEAGGQMPGSMQTLTGLPEIQDLLEPEVVSSREEAEEKLRRGEVDYAVVIPASFDERMSQGEDVKLELLPGRDRDLNLVADTVFKTFIADANHKQAEVVVMGGDQVLAAQAAAPVDASDGPNVTIGQLSEKGATYSAAQYYAASMLIMFLLYSGLMASSSLLGERESRTLYRLQSAPVNPGTVFAGKIIGCSLITLAQAAAIVLGSMWLYGVKWGPHPLLLIVVCVLITLSSMTIATFITLVSSTAAGARGLMQAIIIAMTFVSGGFMPLPVEFFQKLGAFTVNHWAMQSMLRMMLNSDVHLIVTCVGMLAAITAALSAAAMITYRKVGYHA